MKCKDCGHRWYLHHMKDGHPNIFICAGESDSCDCEIINYNIE